MPKTRKHSKTETVVRIDSRGRVQLGPGLEDKDFRVEYAKDGSIFLIPIPEREAWLYRNEKAMNQVRRGLADAAAGRVVKWHPSSEHSEDENDQLL